MSGLVFITGASSGIGQALAARYAQAGWRVVLVARRLLALQDWARAQGLGPDRCGVYAADVRDEAQLRLAAQACLSDWGVPDVVIANAGISVGIDLDYAEDLAVLRDLIDTNVIGLAATFQPFIGPMKRRGSGTLVGVASVASVRGLPGHAGYCAAKGAVVQLCDTLRGELKPHGVAVVTLAPGYIDTEMTRALDERIQEGALEFIPAKRVGTAEEVAGAVSFLASEDASYIAGAVIPVDGGMGMGH